jgi:hypothetical protein
MCAFCGKTVDAQGVDPCDLIVVTKWRAPEEEQREQQFSTHADCLRALMHPDAAQVAFFADVDWDGEF